MNATPFFIAATASIMLPPILSLIRGAKRLITLFVMTMTLWLIIMIAANFTVSRLVKNQHLANTVVIFINITIAFIVYANSAWIAGFNGFTCSMIAGIKQNYAIFAELPSGIAHRLPATLFGLMLATVGINYPIAYALKASGLTPSDSSNDEQSAQFTRANEPARGKAIGYLERAVVLLLMISDNTAAIGFVLAAKAFARFKQLDERNFAEYVLIGTLMSFGSTIVIGIIITRFM